MRCEKGCKLRKFCKRYDLILIGTGVVSVGALKAILDNAQQTLLNKKILIIQDIRDKIQTYDNNQILRKLGSLGNAPYWHGVYPTDKVRNVNELVVGPKSGRKKYIFVPLRAPSPALLKEKLKKFENVDLLAGVVTELKEEGDFVNVRLSDQRIILANNIFMCSGLIGTANILGSSGLFGPTCVVGDHLCGFAGVYSKAFIENKFSIQLKSKKMQDGYLFPYIENDDQNLMIMFRPARLEMKNANEQIRTGPSYGKSKINLLFYLLKNRKFGRLIEALELKFGSRFSSEYYSLHFQYECKAAFQLDLMSEQIKKIFDNDEELKKITQILNNDFSLSPPPDQSLYHGTHLFGANAHLQNTFNGKVKILDSFAMESIGGTHHSVRMMERAYEIISKALK